MDDEQLLRYSRQIMLEGLDIEGQEQLLASSVLVVGLGGLGAPVTMYLAAAGVGRLVLADADTVDLTNLQRQIIHDTDNLEQLKVQSAKDRLHRLNPEVTVDARPERLDGEALDQAVADVDLVVDGSDNFATRFAVNAACIAAGKPLVSGATIRMEGQVAVFDPRDPESACYRCVFPEAGENAERCAETGVLAPMPGIIGSIQATEAIKVLTGLGTPLVNRLMILDGRRMEWRTLRLRRSAECPVCGEGTA